MWGDEKCDLYCLIKRFYMFKCSFWSVVFWDFFIFVFFRGSKHFSTSAAFHHLPEKRWSLFNDLMILTELSYFTLWDFKREMFPQTFCLLMDFFFSVDWFHRLLLLLWYTTWEVNHTATFIFVFLNKDIERAASSSGCSREDVRQLVCNYMSQNAMQELTHLCCAAVGAFSSFCFFSLLLLIPSSPYLLLFPPSSFHLNTQVNPKRVPICTPKCWSWQFWET